MTELHCIEVETQSQLTVSASVILLHGLGASGDDFVSYVRELRLPAAMNVRFVFPCAPEIPVTVYNGYVMPAWYDILEMTLDRKVDEQQLRVSALQVHQLIEREIARGVPSEKIILAGFSQGGAVVYEAALTYAKPLAGLLTMSTYFATHQSIQVNAANVAIPIVIQHGSDDSVVNEVMGQRAYRQLMDRGYKVVYESYPMDHTLCLEQIRSISRWLQLWVQ